MKKRIMLLLTLCILLFSTVPTYAGDSARVLGRQKDEISRVLDEADIISDDVEEELKDTIDDIIDEYEMDVAILLLDDYKEFGDENGISVSSIESFSEECYDIMDLGIDDEGSGILLVVSMAGGEGNRDWCMKIEGDANVAVNDYGSEYITERLVDKLADEDYDEAFTNYVADIQDFYEEYDKGTPYGDDHTVKTPGKMLIYFGSAVGIALVLAFIVVSVMKSKMNTARPQLQAREYVKKGSFVLTNQQDLYLYSNTTKTAIPKSSSSSGGGRSSGSRGGGGRSGKF